MGGPAPIIREHGERPLANEATAKAQSLPDLAQRLASVREGGKLIVHCHGVFDLLHPGHIRHFEAAKRHGDILVVTVTPDRFVAKGPGRPFFNERLRIESIAALGCVDYVAVNEWPTAVEAIKLLRPHFYAKGGDYQDREEEAVRAVGGEMIFTSEITFSSTELLNQYYNVYPDEAKRFLDDFKLRHSPEGVIERLQALQGLKVLVLGEAIIDEYHYCVPVGKSPKEAIVSTRYVREEAFAGGILACANHVAGFCGEVHLVTCLGDQDSREDFIRRHLKPNVTAKFFVRPDACTIVKRRFIWEPFLVKMFEVSFMDDTDVPVSLEEELLAYLKEVVAHYDVVIVADYGHGFLSQRAATTVAGTARFLAVNTQANSANLGYNLITKYPRADYVCIDEPEIRLAMHDRWTRVQDLAEKVRGLLASPAISVTRGHLGALTCDGNGEQWETPVFSREIVDRVGAGDAYLSVTAPCVATGLPMDVVGFVGNAVGALAVRIVGNRAAVEPVSLFKFVTALLK
jgi:rfaE bifunctional protein nucleotidyltransferase chain/domain